MNNKILISLDTASDTDLKEAGHKAKSIVLMKRMGLPVPPGFCVTCPAYSEFLEENNLIPYIKTTLEKISKEPREEKAKLLSGIRQSIMNAPVTDVLFKEIEKKTECVLDEPEGVREIDVTAERMKTPSLTPTGAGLN